MILTPITQLDAVNEIIGTLGEMPVNTLTDAENVDVMNAIRMLDSVVKDVQSRGWTFNTIPTYSFIPDKNSKIIQWNNNLLSVKFSDKRIVRNRNGRLYDITNNTDRFENAIEAEVIMLIPFEEMPQVFRQYCTVRTARLFNARYLGDAIMLQELQEEEQQAYAQYMEYEMTMEKNTVLNTTVIQGYMNRG